MVTLLADNPLLLLFLVCAVGFLAGRVKIRGVGLGVAAVLFVGLGFGALDPALRLPELVQMFGLSLFVYTLGLSSGPGFFASLRRRGVRDALFAMGILALGAVRIGPGTLHPLSLMFFVSGSAMVSATLRIPKP